MATPGIIGVMSLMIDASSAIESTTAPPAWTLAPSQWGGGGGVVVASLVPVFI